MTRAVVVGGGLAGVAAALTLAERGAEVVLLRVGPGATALTWGSVDVAGASPDPAGLPWRDPIHDDTLTPAERLALLLHSRRSHPYGVLFPERDAARACRAIKDAAATLDGWLRPAGQALEGSLDASRLLANVRGAIRVVDFCLGDVGAGDLARAEAVAVVDVPGVAHFAPHAVARTLGAELEALGLAPLPVQVVQLDLPEGLRGDAARPARLAARLDGDSARNALIQAAAGLQAEGRTLLFPPILGLSGSAALRAGLAEAAGGPVAELLGAPPWSPCGLRLERALGEALERAGISVRQQRATRIAPRPGPAVEVTLESTDGSEVLAADVVVLASGRFVGGGVREVGDALQEPLLGLPLYDDRGRRIDGEPARRHLRRRYADPQPLFAAGIRTDGRLRPLDASGHPALARLVAAGELLGGFDPALQRTGLGFALASGLRAGEEAVRLAEEPPA